MPLFPKEPKLQANGQYNSVELDKYVGDVMMTVFIGSLVAITAMAVPTLIHAYKHGKETKDTVSSEK